MGQSNALIGLYWRFQRFAVLRTGKQASPLVEARESGQRLLGFEHGYLRDTVTRGEEDVKDMRGGEKRG